MTSKLTLKQIFTAAAIAALVSVIVNSILFYAFHAMGIITDNIFIQPNQPLTVLPVIISSVLPTFVGAGVFFLFEKYAKNGFKSFSILAVILLVLSFINPFLGIPQVTIPYAIVLNVMHVVVAFSLLYFIKRAQQ